MPSAVSPSEASRRAVLAHMDKMRCTCCRRAEGLLGLAGHAWDGALPRIARAHVEKSVCLRLCLFGQVRDEKRSGLVPNPDGGWREGREACREAGRSGAGRSSAAQGSRLALACLRPPALSPRCGLARVLGLSHALQPSSLGPRPQPRQRRCALPRSCLRRRTICSGTPRAA
jgi:hypothetical protein